MATERSDEYSGGAYLTYLFDTDVLPFDLGTLPSRPSRSWNKHERRSPRVQGVHEFSGFEYAVTEPVQATPSDHLRELVVFLRPFEEALANLSSLPETRSVRVTISHHTTAENAEVRLEPDDLDFLARLNAEVFADIYFLDA